MEDDVENEYLHENRKIELINISINIYFQKQQSMQFST